MVIQQMQIYGWCALYFVMFESFSCYWDNLIIWWNWYGGGKSRAQGSFQWQKCEMLARLEVAFSFHTKPCLIGIQATTRGRNFFSSCDYLALCYTGSRMDLNQPWERLHELLCQLPLSNRRNKVPPMSWDSEANSVNLCEVGGTANSFCLWDNLQLGNSLIEVVAM